ncbi:hypothetical protein [Streptomyces sp. NPDC006610]|uniref:hypothetical protein n=1 Tax=Streptomyces sp. NPDC006610 TaxID=3154584 RepID=UPI0033BC8338
MSRETDSPSSGPNGRGGAAYPSGTPPYGTSAGADGGAGAGRSATQPEERKTETTLTTRIRINIPGSRPIPPVVMRKPVADGESADDTGAEPTTPGAAAPGAGAAGSPAEPADLPRRPVPPAPSAQAADASQPGRPATPASTSAPASASASAEEKTSDWFAPRKSAPAQGAQNGTAAASTGSGPSAGGTAAGAPAPGGARPAAGRPGGVVGAMSLPGGSRPSGVNGASSANGTSGANRTNGAGLPGATGGPVAPGHGGGTGSFDVTDALAAAESRREDTPYFPEEGEPRPGLPRRPAGPTGGPVTGDGPLPPGGPAAGDGPLAPPAAAGHPGHTGALPGGGLSDDTAILTPQKPAPEPPPGGFYGPDNVSGDTVSSGIPVVPSADRPAPFGPGGASDGVLPHTPPKLPEPVQQSVPAAAPPKRKKGRSKLVLLVGAAITLLGVAYGAGLLMNHSDVPKGTYVLGVDIGGGTRDDAVKKLDEALGDRIAKPLKLSVDGDTVSLKPDQAGLQFDVDATVGAAARSDYNPVSVIGSLFGEQRVVEPVMPVDEEKLRSALQTAAGGAGTATEGTIRFESGKAVPVYGKPGKGIAVDQAAEAVEKAYRTQVEKGTGAPVGVPTTTKEPTVAKAEVDRMMKEFAEPAMSDIVTVETDPAHRIAFSPENSLWKFLRVQAVDGKLVDTYDKAALKELYGSTFDGVLITRATGQKTPVTVEDVIGALRPALTSTTNRVATIDTDPS